MGEIGQRRARRQLQRIVRRQMDVHVDQAGQGETSRKAGSGCGRRVADPRDRAAGNLDGSILSAAVHRVDDGDAVDLKPAFRSVSRWSWPLKSKAVE